ncbi:MAG: DNA topoisomerase IV subunit A [Parcubacteria group bacterium Gr01-1014_8]|nr:MAG: DNA topoisomerase IV subunit A [Parcubacteria group bacterium Gr01-1014_8]
MKKILKGIAFALLIPGLAVAAFNDVTLTTDVVLSSNSISLSVYGSSAVLESIEVGSGSFTVTMPSGSSIEVRSTDRKVIEVSNASYITTNVCSTSESRVRLENSGTTATITVTPSSSTCIGSANTASGGGGGGPAPQCEDSIDNDKDGLIDIKDPGCENAADTDETNSAAATTGTATTTVPIATSAATTTLTISTQAAISTQTNQTSAAVSALVAQLKTLIAQLKALGGTVSPSLEATVSALEGGATLPGATFTRDLKLGSTGADVKALQVWLNANGYMVSASGPGSVGNETMMFGSATRAALIKFQKAKGITPAAGYFGPKTRAALGM